MAKATPSTIYLKNVNRDGTQSFDEATAGGTITPGHIVDLTFTNSTAPPSAISSTGGTAASSGQLYIALEKEYDDANTKDAVDATYASGEVLRYVVPKAGDRVYVLAATGVSISIGGLVINGGGTTAGCFTNAGTIDATLVAGTLKAKALTAVTGGASPVRFIAEVL